MATMGRLFAVWKHMMAWEQLSVVAMACHDLTSEHLAASLALVQNSGEHLAASLAFVEEAALVSALVVVLEQESP